MPHRTSKPSRPVGPRSGLRPAALALALATAFGALVPLARAQTLPSGGVAVHGQAAISQPAPNQLRVVTQNGAGTGHSAINWQSFSISAGSTATIVQPTASSLSINRVVTNTPSAIFGNLSSNGRLVLVNQSGIAVGAGAVIDTAGFTASALRMTDADALAGRLRFGEPGAAMGGAAGLTVGGRITARDGDIVLVAPNIDLGTSALLQAPNGSTILAAGQQVEITGRGLEGITMLVQAPADQARNLGRLEGNAVGIFAGTLRHSGEIQATTAVLDGGTVVLKAAGDAYVEGSGKVLATGGKGGRIDVLGQRVAVMDQAVVDASGTQGGGTVRVGGDYQGKNPDLPNAAMAYIGPEAQVLASSTAQGDGGTVIVWADDVTRAYGRIAADGGPDGGAGGLVETSGKNFLDAGGSRVTASSTDGRPGTWLLDPGDINVLHGPNGANAQLTGASPFQPVSSAAGSNISDGTISAALDAQTNVVVTTTNAGADGGAQGNIIFNASLNGDIIIERTVSTSLATLDIQAANNIIFSGGTTTFRQFATGGQGLAVNLSAGGSSVVDAGGQLILDSTNGNSVELVVKGGKTLTNNGTLSLNGNSNVRLPNESGYATLQNATGGTVNINSLATWSFLSDSGIQGGRVLNDGVVNVLLPSAASTSWEVEYNQGALGALNIGTARLLSMQNAGTLQGQVNIGSGSELRLSETHGGARTISSNFGSSPGQLTVVSGVTANFANPTGVLGFFLLDGSAVLQNGTFTTDVYSQSASASLTGPGNLTVVSEFNDGGGVFNPTGALDITQGTGPLTFGRNLSLTSFGLHANAGLTLSGNISTSGNVAIDTSFGAVTLQGDVNAGSNTVTLSAQGGINQTSGAITAGLLTAGGGLGGVSLSGANSVSAATLSGSGAANIVLNNTASNLSLTANAGGVNVTNSGTVTVANSTSAANNNLSITAGTGIQLNAPVTSGSGLTLTTASGGVTQAPAGVISGVQNVINAGSSDINLGAAANTASTWSLTGGNINVNDTSSGGMIVTFISQPVNSSLTLATTGAMFLPGALNNGSGDITLSAGGLSGPPFPAVDLTGGNIQLTLPGGFDLQTNITATGNLTLQTGPSGFITQFSGSIVVGGITTVNSSSAPVSLTSVGNDFNSFVASGNVVSVRDSNAIVLGAIDASTSLSVQANGNITQSAPLVIGGTTTINAGSGNVVLTNTGNNLNSLSVSGSALDIVEGTGSSLTVTALSSGPGEAVSIVAGHTLTLPATPISTGAAPLTLTSTIGPLVVPAALASNTMTLQAGTTLNINANLSAHDLFLTAGGAITQNAGTLTSTGFAIINASAGPINAINARPITLNAVGNDFSLVSTNGSNVILTDANTVQLASSAVFGDYSVASQGNITQQGLSDLQITGQAALTSASGSITVTQVGNNFGSLSLAAASSIDVRNGPSATSVALNGSSSQDVTVTSGGALTVQPGANPGSNTVQYTSTAGLLTINGNVFGSAITLTGGTGITLNADIAAIGPLALTAGGPINQNSGSIFTPPSFLTTVSAGTNPVSLAQGGNDFGLISASSGALSVVDNNNLVVAAAGINSNNGNVVLSATGIGSTTLQGNINAGTGDVTINTRGLTAPGGVVTGATLTVNSSLGSIDLPGANNVTAARLSGSGASTINLNNLNANYALSGTGGTLTVTGPGYVTVDQTLNFATGISISSAAGMTLAANVTPGTNLALTSSTGLIEQTGASTLFASSGTATINAGGSDIALTSASNQFNVVNLAGGHITLLSSNGLIVNTLTSGLGQNVFLDAGAGDLLLPGSAINAGTGQITLTSGGDLLLGGALIGSDILLSASTGLTIGNNIAATGFLNMGSTTGGVAQSGGTSIVVAGTTSVGAGTAAITLNEAGNNFSTLEANGGVITLRDSNALNLGAVNAGTSLSVQANGNVTQTAPVVVAGTTTVNAGTGNVTLTTAGNNLNVLSVSGNAINIAEGAGSNLTVTALSNGLNQPVSLSAGHTLTLPAAPINTGSADLTLSSGIGQLTIPAALSGNNISLSAVTGATVNAPITAAGDFTATVTGGASTMTVNRLVSAGSDMALNLAGNLSVFASAGGAAGFTAAGNQTINAAGNILLQGGASGNNNRAVLSATGSAGTQSVTANGITLLGGNGSGNAASIKSGGFQAVTVGNGGITMTAGGGTQANNFVDIDHVGPVGTSQLITVNGTGSISLQAGSAVGGDSEASIRSEFGGSQTINFTGAGGGRAITLTGGTVGSDSYAEIWTGVGTQLINGAGLITLAGGDSGGGASFGAGDLLGNVAAIVADANHQTISANGMVLQGGAAGLNNLAVVFGGGDQLITLGAGGLELTGGAGGGSALKNAAFIWKGTDVPGTAQTIRVGGGGAITLQGGSASGTNVGTDANFFALSNGAFAMIRSDGVAQLIEFTAPGGSIQITGGTVGSDNFATIVAFNGTQTIRGSSAANAPGLALSGGASGGAANEGNRAMIESIFGNQNLTAGAISLTGGIAGASNLAQILQGDISSGLANTQTVTVVGGGDITMQGGGGNRNLARILAFGTTQTVSFSAGGAINATGGASGIDNLAQIIAQNGDQFVTGATAIDLHGGSGGNNSRAQITAPLGSQTLTVGSGGLSLTGGSGSAAELTNLASVFQGGTTGKSQTITVSGGGDITLMAGDSAGTNVGLDNGSLAYITSQGDSQLIEFSGAGSTLSVTGGTTGSRNEAGIMALSGSQTIGGTTAGNAPAIVLIGGADGGLVGESNLAQIAVNAGAQSITARSISLQGGADGTENIARIRQGTPSNGLASNQSITITGGGALSLQGGGGVTNLADVRAHGPLQTIAFSAGGSLSVTGGAGASLNFANIESVNGDQTISGAPSITVTGGASGGASLLGNFASIQAGGPAAVQNIASGAMTLNAGTSGTNNFAFVGAAEQVITVNGNLALNGGGSAGSLDGTLGGGARIGAPGTAATDLTLDVTGNLTMTGGSLAGVVIGAGVVGGAATDLTIRVGGNVSLLNGAIPSAGARIGSPSVLLGGGNILIDAVGTVTLGGETGVFTAGDILLEGDTLAISGAVLGNKVELHGLSVVTLGTSAAIAATRTGDALIVRVDNGGSFFNTASANPLSAPNGRWLVYSEDPIFDLRGNLVHDFKQYNAVPGGPVQGTGNGVLYSLASPSVTASLVGAVSKGYDGTTAATLAAGNYSAVGIDGDVITLNNPTAGTYDTKGIGSGKLVIAGGLAVVSVVDAASKPVFGYNPLVSPAGGLVGEITAATITAISGITALDKVYDTTTAATLVTGGAVFAGKAASDNLTLASATGAFDTKDVGTGKTVTVTGLSLSGLDAGNYILSASGATATGNITPATISAVTGITAANKVYDGTTAATLTTSGAAFTGRLGSDVLTVATAVGNFSDKNVANPKTVNVTGLSISGADAGNYTLGTTTATTAAAITPATITAVSGITASKVYDGNASATAASIGATFTGAIAGDNLTLAAASASFSDRHVGTGKTLTATGLTLGGTDAGNYSFATTSATGTGDITQRPVSTWSGAGGNALWSNPLNWDALPDGNNVAAVSIPAGAGNVVFDSGVAATSLQTVSSQRPLSMTSGSLSVGVTLLADDFSQSGGTLGGAGDLIVGNSFSQTGGSIAMGNITIVQNSGNLSFTSLSGTTVALVAQAGSISQSGPLVAGTVTTSSLSGTTLTNGSNQFSNLYAQNLGTGAIDIVNSAPLNVLGLDNAGGDVSVSTTGAMSTFGPVVATTGSVTLAALGSGGNLGLFGPVTAGNQVVFTAADTLTQDAAVVGTNGVTADAGSAIVFGPFATANFSPVVYRIGGVVSASPPAEIGLGAVVEEVAPLLVFEELLQAAVEIPPDEPDDFTAEGKRKEKTDDTIVTEGEVCK